jgi:hypothetical protein
MAGSTFANKNETKDPVKEEITNLDCFFWQREITRLDHFFKQRALIDKEIKNIKWEMTREPDYSYFTTFSSIRKKNKENKEKLANLNKELEKWEKTIIDHYPEVENFLGKGFSLNELWLCFIDGKYHICNDPFIFNQRRVTTCGEPGYFQSMQKTYLFMLATLRIELSIPLMMAFHEMATKDTTFYDGRGKEIKRSERQGMRDTTYVAFGFAPENTSFEGLVEMQQEDYNFVAIRDQRRSPDSESKEIKKNAHLLWDAMKKGTIYYRSDPKEVEEKNSSQFVKDNLTLFLKEYHREIKTDDPYKKIMAIAKFVHKCELLHIWGDGNIRTLILIANKLLLQNGFPPMICPHNPTILNGFSVSQIAAEMLHSMKKYVLYNPEAEYKIDVLNLEEKNFSLLSPQPLIRPYTWVGRYVTHFVGNIKGENVTSAWRGRNEEIRKEEPHNKRFLT